MPRNCNGFSQQPAVCCLRTYTVIPQTIAAMTATEPTAIEMKLR